MKQIYFLLFTVFSSVIIAQTVVPPPELQAYYEGITYSASNSNLYDELATKTIGKHTTFLTYSQRHNFLYDADANPADQSEVVLIYSGDIRPDNQWLSGSNPDTPQTYNTEHVYPRSLLDTGTAEADLHVLRVCDIDDNTLRGNDPFTSGSGGFSSTGNAFFPGDDWRGDVARIILYANLRYNEPFDAVGSLSLFLQWNAADPVLDGGIEDQRNTVISGAQGVRNPFIDNPYLATLIWGGADAQNRWMVLSNDDFKDAPAFTIFPNPTQGDIQIKLKNSVATRVEIFDILGKKVLNTTLKMSDTVETSRLKSGVYIIRLTQNGKTETSKLVKR
ncbi:endonuclease [Winogradskyella maritima]|uniref:Endonuclease n=1 Tax=Winogradskyella maritima TaxID=1517766 RepID=A0ABV8AI33_9FLAO|nr:endonuclease [Winogradskyella maritima]